MTKLMHVGLGSGLLALCLLVPPRAFAQSAGATTAAIDGIVTDTSGAPLPGVTITAASPALQGVRVVVTGGDGTYRLPQLPPGEYRLTYEMEGFATFIRERQQLSVGFNATIPVRMPLSAMQETLTVTGEAPVVDQRASKLVTNFDAAKLDALPGARDLWAIVGASPAVQMNRVDVGGSAAGTQTGYSAYDTKMDQHRPMVEGIVATEGTGAAGFYYDYGSFDEVSVQTGSHGADMGWAGVATAFVSKSGGNVYHGRARFDYQNGGLQSVNIDADQIARGIRGGGGVDPADTNRMERYLDLNGDLGGFVVKDRLWWYGSVRNQQIDVRYPNYPGEIFVTKLHNVAGKGTYTLSPNHKLVGYTQWGRKNQPNRLDTYLVSATSAIHRSPESTWNQLYWAHVSKGEWNGVFGGRAFVEVRGGRFGYDWPNHRNSDAPSFQDLGNNEVSGGNREWGLNRRRDQAHGSVSMFKNGWLGAHNVKFGGEVFRETAVSTRGLADAADPSGFPGDTLHVLRNGEPIEVYLFGAPTISQNGLWTYAGYVNDTWQAASRLTMNVGLRYERYRSFLPAQQRLAGRFYAETIDYPATANVLTWNLWSPRIGVNYDLTGNGRTVLKFNIGQYWWNPGTGLAEGVNTNSPDWFQRYRWADTNGSGLWDAGEEGTLIASSGGANSTSLDPNLKDTYTREVAGWLEREVAANFGVRTGVVYRRIGNQYQRNHSNRPFEAFSVPVTVQDPGPDGRAGTTDDGQAFQAFNLAPEFVGRPTVFVTENVPGVSEFWTWELSATKRMSNRWSLIAGLSYRWNEDFATAYQGNNLRSGTMPMNPNELVNTDEGRFDFTTWAFKVSGTIEAPRGLVVSPSFRHQAGQPFGRTFLATMNYGSQRLLAEPISSQRQDHVNVLDVRLEKQVRVASQRLTGFFDLYNITNANTEQNINWSSGTTYLLPSSIIGPRIARFGLKYDW